MTFLNKPFLNEMVFRCDNTPSLSGLSVYVKKWDRESCEVPIDCVEYYAYETLRKLCFRICKRLILSQCRDFYTVFDGGKSIDKRDSPSTSKGQTESKCTAGHTYTHTNTRRPSSKQVGDCEKSSKVTKANIDKVSKTSYRSHTSDDLNNTKNNGRSKKQQNNTEAKALNSQLKDKQARKNTNGENSQFETHGQTSEKQGRKKKNRESTKGENVESVHNVELNRKKLNINGIDETNGQSVVKSKRGKKRKELDTKRSSAQSRDTFKRSELSSKKQFGSTENGHRSSNVYESHDKNHKSNRFKNVDLEAFSSGTNKFYRASSRDLESQKIYVKTRSRADEVKPSDFLRACLEQRDLWARQPCLQEATCCYRNCLCCQNYCRNFCTAL